MSKSVYIIQHPDGYYKIGVSKRPRKRIKKLQNGCPKQLVLWAKVRCSWLGDSVETDLHKQFSERHVRNEWFDLSEEEITEAIEERLKDEDGDVRSYERLDHEPDRSVPNSVKGGQE